MMYPPSAEQELESALNDHDWSYVMSDDPKYYHAGEKSERNIHSLMKEIGKEDSIKLWEKYVPKNSSFCFPEYLF